MRYVSPLRYPGGKGRFATPISRLIEYTSATGGTYVEPFAGGASVGIRLLRREVVRHIHINDFDKAVYSFWKSIVQKPEQFCSFVRNTPVNVNEWHRQKIIYENSDQYDELEVGFATFFLNRTNHSGIIEGAPIGGYSQQGNWKIDARYNAKELVQRIEALARYRRRIQVSNCDGVQLISEYEGKKRIFMYIDPPYYHQGGRLYLNGMSSSHHSLLRDILKNVDINFLLTYDNCEEINSLYRDFNRAVFEILYSAKRKRTEKEVAVFRTSDHLDKWLSFVSSVDEFTD